MEVVGDLECWQQKYTAKVLDGGLYLMQTGKGATNTCTSAQRREQQNVPDEKAANSPSDVFYK